MIRTQIYLDKPLYEVIKLRAKVAGKPAAQVIRELLDQGLKAKSEQPRTGHRLDGLVNLKLHGPKDMGSNIDHYLYDK